MSDVGLAAIGFAAGLFSTTLMSLFEALLWERWEIAGVLEWHENQAIWNRLAGKPASTTSFFGIFFLHFLNGGLAAIPFPFVGRILPMPVWVPLPLLGVSYGIVLWLLTLFPIHRPITGVSLADHPFGLGPVAGSLVGHILYGVSLGVLSVV